ncbi:MAG: GspE/PulE family protein, partial [Patescibacteria group bacterium]
TKVSHIRRDAEERAAQARAKQSGTGYIDIRKAPTSLDALRLLTEEQARKAQVAVIQTKPGEAALAAYDPRNEEVKAVEKILKEKGLTVKLFTVSEDGLEEVWKMYRFVPEEVKEITGNVEVSKADFDETKARLKDFHGVEKEFVAMDFEHVGTTKFFELILVGAITSRASDIHLEAEEKGARFRYRIDGVLHDVSAVVPTRNFENIVTRVKLLAGLKLNIKSETQDGRFTIRLAEKDIEMRVSIIPSQYGETIVMRILDPAGINVTLEQLGFRPDDLELVRHELNRPNGLILNTGPTGSGKTTTLYTFLRSVSSPEMKVITIEDPVEYHLPGISQTQTDAKAGYTFASGLRAILRQDPDIILVGEIRDLETAEIAMNASLTGHLVFSTLHTNDALGAVPRFVDLGVKPAILGPGLSLVIAQRLVRKLCEKCKKPAEINDDMKGKIQHFLDTLPKRIDRKPYENYKIYEPVGCEVCGSFGFKGRLGMYEFFRNTPELQEMIAQGVTVVALRKEAKNQEMIFLQQDGILKVLQGVTSFPEVVDVTGEIEWEEK